MTDVEKLKLLTGESDDKLLSLLLEDATEFVLAYTGRSQIVTGMEKTVRVIALNRMGTEGESSRSAAGESYSFEDAPKQVYDVLDRFRLARVGGKVYEAKTEQAAEVLSPRSDPPKG